MHVELTQFPDEELTDEEPIVESSEDYDSSDASDEEMDATEGQPQILCDCEERLSREEREFVVFDGKCEHWSNGTYKPPVKLQYLMNEHEKKDVEVAMTEYFNPKTPPRRRIVKSVQQPESEKSTRRKRRDLKKEALRYRESLKTHKSNLKPTFAEPVTPTPAARYGLLKNSLPTPPHSPASQSNSNMVQVFRRIFPSTHDIYAMGAQLRAAVFTTPRKQSDDSISLRSGGSEEVRQDMLDAIQWDSD